MRMDCILRIKEKKFRFKKAFDFVFILMFMIHSSIIQSKRYRIKGVKNNNVCIVYIKIGMGEMRMF